MKKVFIPFGFTNKTLTLTLLDAAGNPINFLGDQMPSPIVAQWTIQPSYFPLTVPSGTSSIVPPVMINSSSGLSVELVPNTSIAGTLLGGSVVLQASIGSNDIYSEQFLIILYDPTIVMDSTLE